MSFRAAQAQGELALAEGDYATAVEVSNDFLASNMANVLHAYAPYLQHLKARALLAQGDAKVAKTVLEEGRAAAEGLGSRWILWEILARLAEVEAELGDQAEATRLRIQAREIVDFIAEHAGSDELRESFLRRQAVQSLMDA